MTFFSPSTVLSRPTSSGNPLRKPGEGDHGGEAGRGAGVDRLFHLVDAHGVVLFVVEADRRSRGCSPGRRSGRASSGSATPWRRPTRSTSCPWPCSPGQGSPAGIELKHHWHTDCLMRPLVMTGPAARADGAAARPRRRATCPRAGNPAANVAAPAAPCNRRRRVNRGGAWWFVFICGHPLLREILGETNQNSSTISGRLAGGKGSVLGCAARFSGGPIPGDGAHFRVTPQRENRPRASENAPRPQPPEDLAAHVLGGFSRGPDHAPSPVRLPVRPRQIQHRQGVATSAPPPHEWRNEGRLSETCADGVATADADRYLRACLGFIHFGRVGPTCCWRPGPVFTLTPRSGR